MRFDIVSDTHGHLSEELIAALQGADYIVHAGDICSDANFRRLQRIAPVHACLGNNDWGGEYGPDVKRTTKFFAGGLRWQVLRSGADFRLRCLGCGRCVEGPRGKFEKNIRKIERDGMEIAVLRTTGKQTAKEGDG